MIKITKPSDVLKKYSVEQVIEFIENEIKKENFDDCDEDGFIHIFIPTKNISDYVIKAVEKIYLESWENVSFSVSSDSPTFSIYLYL